MLPGFEYFILGYAKLFGDLAADTDISLKTTVLCFSRGVLLIPKAIMLQGGNCGAGQWKSCIFYVM